MYDNIIEWPRILLEKVLWIYCTLSSVTEGCSKLPTFCFLCTRSLLLIISGTAGFRPRPDQGIGEGGSVLYIDLSPPRMYQYLPYLSKRGFCALGDNVVRFTRLFSRFHLQILWRYIIIISEFVVHFCLGPFHVFESIDKNNK